MTMWAIMRRIIQEEGIRGLYTGIIPRISRVAPACAIMLSSYEAGYVGRWTTCNNCDLTS